MLILGLQKMTLLDYPGKIACTVFLGGCNFRCPYCHNATSCNGQPLRPRLTFLRRNWLPVGPRILWGEILFLLRHCAASDIYSLPPYYRLFLPHRYSRDDFFCCGTDFSLNDIFLYCEEMVRENLVGSLFIGTYNAPCRLWNDDGGTGAQMSSPISTANVPAPRSKMISGENGHTWSA